MTEIKTELKLARDAIKKQDYTESLKHCKNVLKVDKENYNALVFVGKCATELEQFDQAKQAYQKAIAQKNEEMLAWQGLCSLLEHVNDSIWDGELKKCYHNFLDIYMSDMGKWKEIYFKLTTFLSKNGLVAEELEWRTKIAKKGVNEADVCDNKKKIISLLTLLLEKNGPQEEKVLELLAYFKDVLPSESGEDLEKLYESYLTALVKYATHNYPNYPSLNDIAAELETGFMKFESNMKIAQLFCCALINKAVVDGDLHGESLAVIVKIAEKIPHSSDENLVFGVLKYADHNHSKALEYLSDSNQTDPIAIYFMAKCHYLLHHHNVAMTIIEQLSKLFENAAFPEVRKSLQKNARILEIQIMLERDIPESKKEAIFKPLLENLLSHEEDANVQLVKLQVEVVLGNADNVKEIISKLDGKLEGQQKCLFLQIKADISMREETFYDAEIRLQEATEVLDDWKNHFLLGKVYWSLGNKDMEYYQKSYSEFLKAAKRNPFYASTFVYLGRYQREFVKDIAKATRCFEKAFSLDVSNTLAGIHLGDIYLQSGLEEKAANVYEEVTKQAQAGESIWAWVRRGLICIKQNKPDEAIVCFQHALRGDVNVSHHWECLGDGYYMKGSYASALKAYAKALELDGSSTYCMFRIGKVKQMLHHDNEAIAIYEKILLSQPDHVPVLLALCETHLQLVQKHLLETFDGRAMDHAQIILDYASRALSHQPTYSCIWKTVGDALTALHVIKTDKCFLIIPKYILQLFHWDHDGKASKADILDLATRCFSMAVKLRGDIPSYWHDLAVSNYRLAMVLENEKVKHKVLQSIQMMKKAISIDVTNPMFWNTLGVMTGGAGPSQKCCGHDIDEIQNPALSQHAFIKALQLKPLDASIWANLGMLYIKHGKIKAAHEAFKKAQSCDPQMVRAWVGQAYVAETVGDHEAMDLFRHSTQLSYHIESSLGYAQWVFKLLKYEEKQSILLSAFPRADLSHLPQDSKKVLCNSSDCLQKTIGRIGQDAWAYNTLGLLLEHQALYRQAEKVFSKSREILSNLPVDDNQTGMLCNVLINLARVLRTLGKYDDAIEIYNIVGLKTSIELCNLALAYYMSGCFDRSQETYEKALKVCENDKEKSEILAALGMVAYASKRTDAAKSLLFQSSQVKDCNEHGLMALTALGLLLGDGTLATAALMELSRHKSCNKENFEVKRSMLLSSFHSLQGQLTAAERSISKFLLRFPRNSHLWSLLSKFLTESNTQKLTTSLSCSRVAIYQSPTEIAAKVAAFNSIAFPHNGSREVLRQVQRFVHRHPDKPESWVLLTAGLQLQAILNNQFKSLLSVINLALVKVDNHLNLLKNNPLENRNEKYLKMYTKLYSWMMETFVISNIYYGECKIADSFCNRIIPTLNGDSYQADFIFLKGMASLQEQKINQLELGVENLRVMSTIAAQSKNSWKWKVLVDFYLHASMPVSSELCCRRIMQFKNNTTDRGTLLKMCTIAIKVIDMHRNEGWLSELQDFISQLLKRTSHSDGDVEKLDNVLTLFRSILFYHQHNHKVALKYLNKLSSTTDEVLTAIQRLLLLQWNKKDGK